MKPQVFRSNRSFTNREWFKRSVLNHRHDRNGAFLKPVVRWQAGSEVLPAKQDWRDVLAQIKRTFWLIVSG